MKITGRSVSSFLIVVLNVARYTLGIVLVVTVAILAIALLADVRGLDLTVVPPAFGVSPEVHSNWTLTIPVLVEMDETHATSRSAATVLGEIQNLRGSLRFPIERGAVFILNAFVLIFAIGLALWVITELTAVLRTVRDGHPFVASNAARVRRIACAVIAGEVARAAIVYFENSYAMAHFSAQGLRFAARLDFGMGAILEGFIILVIAEVFRAGTRLDEEQSLTV